MKKQIDYFLLGLLWILASILGASFWFNTRFSFDIFSVAHWHYLGQMQAAHATVSPVFYFSMIVISFAVLAGLYLIVSPRFRKIRFNIQKHAAPVSSPMAKQPLVTTPHTTVTSPNTPVTAPVMTSARPPRLSLPKISAPVNHTLSTDTHAIPQASQIPNTAFDNRQATTVTSDFAELAAIFESAGYIVKKPPRIGNFRPALFAIGADETLWVGGTEIELEKIITATEKLKGIFSETLEDIPIHVKPFVINPIPSAVTQPFEIKKFDSVNDLRDFMNDNKNRALGTDEQEDFDAYSDYIDTVANYFNKL